MFASTWTKGTEASVDALELQAVLTRAITVRRAKSARWERFMLVGYLFGIDRPVGVCLSALGDPPQRHQGDG